MRHNLSQLLMTLINHLLRSLSSYLQIAIYSTLLNEISSIVEQFSHPHSINLILSIDPYLSAGHIHAILSLYVILYMFFPINMYLKKIFVKRCGRSMLYYNCCATAKAIIKNNKEFTWFTVDVIATSRAQKIKSFHYKMQDYKMN